MLNRKKEKDISENIELILSEDTNIGIIEQFRTIQTNINFSMFDNNFKSIVITSANRNSGKTFLAINLAMTFAKEDYKVLLVDADLRKPKIHERFKLSNKTGLTSIIRTPDKEIQKFIYEMETPGLYLLVSGQLPPNPSELLSSKRMSEIIKKLEKMYDLVLIDAPPLLPIVDSQILTSKVGGTIVVIPKGEVTKEEVYKSKKILDTAEAKVIGVILNKTDKKSDNYY